MVRTKDNSLPVVLGKTKLVLAVLLVFAAGCAAVQSELLANLFPFRGSGVVKLMCGTLLALGVVWIFTAPATPLDFLKEIWTRNVRGSICLFFWKRR